MAKLIRPTYPLEFSIGILLLVFLLSAFLSFEIFDANWRTIMEGEGPISGMILSAVAVVTMILILWEEFLFPVRIKPVEEQIVFRNHLTKLRTQVLIYCIIPVIVLFIYFNYHISPLPFFIWAAICLGAPVVNKLISGIKNYNDFLSLSNDAIQYRNNEKEALLPVVDIVEIRLLRDDANVLHKVNVIMQNNTAVIIDLDEMELEAYYQTIDEFITGHYGKLVNIK